MKEVIQPIKKVPARPRRRDKDGEPKPKAEASAVAQPCPAKEFYNPTIKSVGVKIVVDEDIFIPTYKSQGAACADLVANLPQGEVRMNHRSMIVVDCGFSMEMPPGHKALISLRSSFGKKGLVIPNSPAVIDSDFRGRIEVVLVNIGRELVVLKPNERFAQMRIEPVYAFEWSVVDKLSDTDRGVGGFGSTGV